MTLNSRQKSTILQLMARDFCNSVESGATPTKLSYSIETTQFKKLAFDTRRINQETERNPRSNLQFYQRSEPHLHPDEEEKLKSLAILVEPLNQISEEYGGTPDYHNSYARQLHDQLKNVFASEEINAFKPKLDYLSQILYMRYRITPETLKNSTAAEIKDIILKKDETLLKKSMVSHFIKKPEVQPSMPTVAYVPQPPAPIEIPKPQIINLPAAAAAQPSINIKTGDVSDGLAQAIFAGLKRNEGENSLTRTITIQIVDKAE